MVTVAGLINREPPLLHHYGAGTSADGSTADQFTININDVDEFNVTTPVDADATLNEVAENSAVGTVVGVTALCMRIPTQPRTA